MPKFNFDLLSSTQEDQTNSDRLLLLLSFYRVISYIFRLPILYIMCNSYSWVITAPDRVTMVDRLLGKLQSNIS